MSLPCTPSDELEKISVRIQVENVEAIFKSYELKIYTERENFKRRKKFFFQFLSRLYGKNFKF